MSIDPGNQTVWEAFDFMNKFRKFNRGQPKRLTITDILAYCELAGISDPDQRLRIASAVVAMDMVYLRWTAEHGRDI